MYYHATTLIWDGRKEHVCTGIDHLISLIYSTNQIVRMILNCQPFVPHFDYRNKYHNKTTLKDTVVLHLRR
jgi:hypothetical protein